MATFKNFFSASICMAAAICSAALARDVQLDNPAPAIEATTLDGKTFDLSRYKSKVVIVNFWATWCGPCREEMPALDAYYKQHRDEGLEVLAISTDVAGDLAKVRDVMGSYSFPAALISESKLPGYGRIRQIPQTYVIDRQGIMRRDGGQDKGKIDGAFLDAVVTPLLRSRATAGTGGTVAGLATR